ncbi:hypothetical protein BD410DRAFT_86971 [Rickenella mellea]|uniref:F-box domain-containing protein n=1 Tax=Rickenella mellea TaxID=50990 RepID=A0A4Y7PMB4_9AGAM|nr:hypothetical protein BD410DRAFT_86971 [Rickenella mellea]
MPRYQLIKFLSVIPSRTPKIRTLTVRVFDAFLIDRTRLPIDAYIVFSPCGSKWLLRNLRSLNLQLVDQFDLIECLSHSPRIEEVRAWFNFSTQKLQPIHHHVDVSLAHLTYLDITLNVDSWDQGKFGPFEHFRLPVIKTLLLRVFGIQHGGHGFDIWDLSIDFACQYKSSLQNLEIDGRFFTTPPPFLDRLPKLRHLGIPMGDLNNDLIHGLVSRFSSSAHQSCRGYSCLESLCVFPCSKGHGAANLHAIIDHAAEKKSSATFHPVIVVVTYDLFKSLSLHPGCVVEIMKQGDWRERRRNDLYREIGSE